MTDVLWTARRWTRLPLAICLSPVCDAQTAKSAQVASEWIAGQRVSSAAVYSGGDLSPSAGRKAFQVFHCATLNLNRVVHSSPGSSPVPDPKSRPTVPAPC